MNRNGFTTIEIIVVVSLFSFVSLTLNKKIRETTTELKNKNETIHDLQNRADDCDKLEEYLRKHGKHPQGF